MPQSSTESRPEPFFEDHTIDSASHPPAAVILVEDLVARRLIEAASAQLGLAALAVQTSDEIRSIRSIDLIIADEPVARDILAHRQTPGSPSSSSPPLSPFATVPLSSLARSPSSMAC